MKWLKTNKSSRQKLQYQSCIAIASSFVRFIHLMWYTTWQFVQHIVIAKDCTYFLHIPHLLCSAILLCIDKHEQDRYSGTCNIVSGFSTKYRYCHICVVSWITMKEAWIQYYYQFSVIPCLVHYWKLLMGLFNSVMYFIDVITIMSVHGLVISVPRLTRTDPRPAVRPAEGPNSFHWKNVKLEVLSCCTKFHELHVVSEYAHF